MSRRKLSASQRKCVGQASKIMQACNMIGPGSRIGVAASGGADSFALLEVLHQQQRIVPFSFEFMALHINPGFDPTNHAPLVEWLTKKGVAGHIAVTQDGIKAHSEENRTNSPCYLCAMYRRKRLFDLVRQYKLTHLAFGHNADDIVHTFFLNMLQNGRVEGLSISESFFKGTLQVIRPLALVEKSVILKAVRRWELPVWSNPCPSAGCTARAAMSDVVNELGLQNKLWKPNLFNGIVRWQQEQLKTLAKK